MNSKKQFLIAIFSLFTMATFAQSYQVSGTVTDSDNQPLPGVSVTIEGTSRGTTTDFDGKYTIKVEMSENLIFSYVGFNDKKLQMDGTKTFDVVLVSGVSLNEVVVVGSRNPNRTAVDTAVPVDIIDVTELITAGPQVNLNQILNYVAPSFTSNTQTISDGTDHIDPASLRGLGPDQVLVLINGKRRHSSSLINVNGTFGRGSVGTDLNAIPAASIERIEVLRDGAAAQYGSDAIAGVINIVLKRSTNELTMNVTTGAYFSENSNGQTGGNDGQTTNISANYGLQLGDKGGFLNFTGDFDVRDEYNRMKEFEGDIFNLYNTIERVANDAGYDITNLLDDDVSDVIQYGNMAGLGLDPNATKADLQSILSADNTTAELAARGMERSDFNMRVGQSALRGGRFFANFSLPLNDDGTELYSFAGVSSRVGNSAGFYRLPSQERTYTPAYINGFLPEINSAITDKSFAVGIKGKVSDWDIDFSNTFGKNEFLYTIGNTFNASMQGASPTTFDAGGFSFAQNTTNLDISKFYDDKMSGVNVAFGAEYRVETYEIYAGEEGSYAQYTADGQVITTPSQDPSVDFFDRARPGGSQVFPGFSPANELSRGRSSVAGYLDVEADISEKFLVSLATRYEDYSDFGSTLNFKIASRIKAGDNTNIRAAFNTGFRAPSLHQLNFNSTSTIFDQDGNPIEVGTFSNDSRAAELLGIPQLKEETSRSMSVGFTTKIPDAHLTITVDGYWVGIDDRVIYTGRFSGPGTGTELDNLLSQANAGAAAFFANAIDTESKGLDIVITHDALLGDNAKLKTDLAATFSGTKRVGAINSSQILRDAGLETTYFDEASRVYLEDAVPGTKINLSHSLTTDKFNVFLRNVYFGEVTEATTVIERQQVFGTKVVTDLSFGYKVSETTTITIGANNLLDVEPDRAEIAFSDGGTNRSSGRFDWSRRAQQFGVGGRFLFARLNFVLK
ncbi:TonB-dependent receptor [Lutibacter sp.]